MNKKNGLVLLLNICYYTANSQLDLNYKTKLFHSDEVYMMYKNPSITPDKIVEMRRHDESITFDIPNKTGDSLIDLGSTLQGGEKVKKTVDWKFYYGLYGGGGDHKKYYDVKRTEKGVTKKYNAYCYTIPFHTDLVCLLVDEGRERLTIELTIDLAIVKIREYTSGKNVYTYHITSVEVLPREY